LDPLLDTASYRLMLAIERIQFMSTVIITYLLWRDCKLCNYYGKMWNPTRRHCPIYETRIRRRRGTI